jgi:hypothetical protein
MEPVFVIGSYRSGTSILTWSLGQHFNIFPLEETNWIYRLGVYLDCLYTFGTLNREFSNLSSMGITRTKFYRSFGKYVHSMIMENRVNYLRANLKTELKKKNLLHMVDLKRLTTVEDFAEYTMERDLFPPVRSRL